MSGKFSAALERFVDRVYRSMTVRERAAWQSVDSNRDGFDSAAFVGVNFDGEINTVVATRSREFSNVFHVRSLAVGDSNLGEWSARSQPPIAERGHP